MTKHAPQDAALFKGESAAELLPIEMIEPWEHNPRRTRDETKLAELADSIAKVGVLQPILVRPVRDGAMMSIVIGERRWRAARRCGLTHIPAVVREMSEAEALELAVTENLQREDVPPLEEAEGYERLHDVHGYTVEEIADRVGKSRTYVYARLKLTALCEDARAIVREHNVSPTIALLAARLPVPSQQVEALEHVACDHTGRPMTVTQASEVIRHNWMLHLGNAPFDTTDATLCPAAGACVDCRKRTGNQPELFGDIAEGDTCTDSTCYEGKTAAAHERRGDELQAAGRTVLRGEDAAKVFRFYGHVTDEYIELDDRCPHDKHGKRTWRDVLAGTDVTPLAVDAGERRGYIDVVPADAAQRALVKLGMVEEGDGRVPPARNAPERRPARNEEELARERFQRGELLRALLVPGYVDGPSLLEWREIAQAMNDNYWPEPRTRDEFEKPILGDCESVGDFIEDAHADQLQQLVRLMALYQYVEGDPIDSLGHLKAIVADTGLDAEDIATAAGKTWDARHAPEPEPAAEPSVKPKKSRKKKATTNEEGTADV